MLHAFLELIGMLVIGYAITRLILNIPIVNKSFIYRNKKRVNSASNPNPVVDSYKLEIGENVISNSNPVQDFNKGNDYPLNENTFDMSATPFAEKADNLFHSEEIIAE